MKNVQGIIAVSVLVLQLMAPCVYPETAAREITDQLITRQVIK